MRRQRSCARGPLAAVVSLVVVAATIGVTVRRVDAATNGFEVLSLDGTTSPGVLRDGDEPSVSADGRYVAYWGHQSAARNAETVWLRDRTQAAPRAIATASGGDFPFGASLGPPAISADGCVVAFDRWIQSSAGLWNTTLFAADVCRNAPPTKVAESEVLCSAQRPGPRNALEAQATPRLFRAGPNGTCALDGARVSISADGQVIEVMRWLDQAYVADRRTPGNSGYFFAPGDGAGDLTSAAISADGTRLTTTVQPRVIEGPALSGTVVVFDVASRRVVYQAPLDPAPTTPPIGATSDPGEVAVSGDGGVVAFTAQVACGNCGVRRLAFLHDRASGRTTLVSPADASWGAHVSVSGDGGTVAFASVGANQRLPAEVLVVDVATRGAESATAGADGVPTTSANEPSLSGNGAVVAFHADRADLLPGAAVAARDPTVPSQAVARVRPLHLSIAPVAFPDTTVNTPSAAKALVVVNAGPTRAVIGTVRAGGEYAAAVPSACDGVVLAPKASCTVPVTFTPTAVGARPGQATVTDVGGNTAAGVALTGRGVAVAVTGLAIDDPGPFPDTPVGQEAPKLTTVVRNTGNRSLTLTATPLAVDNVAEFDASGPKCAKRTLAPGATCALTLTFVPTASGDRTATLTATANGNVTATLTLRGRGVDTAGLTAAPNPVVFPTTPVGTVATPMVVTVSNAGTQPLTLTPLKVVDGNAPEFPLSADGCGGAALAPGASCTVAVGFSPPASGLEGLRAATLDVVATSGTEIRVALQAVAVRTPVLRFEPLVATQGSVLAAVGAGFPPAKTLTIAFDGLLAPVTLATDATGGFRVPVLISRTELVTQHHGLIAKQPGLWADDITGTFLVTVAPYRPQGTNNPAFRGGRAFVSRG